MSEFDEDTKSKIDDLIDWIEDIQGDVADFTTQITVDKTGGNNSWGFDTDGVNPVNVMSEYEQWYNSAYPFVSDYLPDRKEEFENRYNSVRKGLEVDIAYIRENDINSETTLGNIIMQGIIFQHNLISSIPDRVESKTYRAKQNISSNITSNEIQKAKELFDDENIRAAGVVGGVALERHLLTLCESSNQELDYGYMDGITTLAQTLSNADEITNDDERLLEYLSGVRNKCSHATEDEPERREVERMLNQADQFIKNG